MILAYLFSSAVFRDLAGFVHELQYRQGRNQGGGATGAMAPPLSAKRAMGEPLRPRDIFFFKHWIKRLLLGRKLISKFHFSSLLMTQWAPALIR